MASKDRLSLVFISLVSYSIIVSNEPKGFGCRDCRILTRTHCLPNIFIWIMGVINHMLLSEVSSRNSSIGAEIYHRAIKFLCLLCACDNLIFCKANSNSCNVLTYFNYHDYVMALFCNAYQLSYTKTLSNNRLQCFIERVLK